MSQLVPTNSSPVWNTWENDIMSTMYWHAGDYKTNSYKMDSQDYSQVCTNEFRGQIWPFFHTSIESADAIFRLVGSTRFFSCVHVV